MKHHVAEGNPESRIAQLEELVADIGQDIASLSQSHDGLVKEVAKLAADVGRHTEQINALKHKTTVPKSTT